MNVRGKSMAACAYCGTTIILGGVKDGEDRYCNNECAAQGEIIHASRQIPDEILDQAVAEIHQGPCPICEGPGPVDVHTSYRVWSALFLTSWSSRPRISCRSCGFKAKFADLFFCFGLGWWGFPWGLLATPIQIVRNFWGMVAPGTPMEPSEVLRNMVRLDLAARAVDYMAAEQAAGPPPPLP
jgi:hypothetical protein